jgi:hypothetical protein
MSTGRETSPCDEEDNQNQRACYSNLTPDHKVHLGSDPDPDLTLHDASY